MGFGGSYGNNYEQTSDRNCQTTDWSDWSPCSKTCIGEDLQFGIMERSRPPSQPVKGGKLFSGPSKETRSCGPGTNPDTVK